MAGEAVTSESVQGWLDAYVDAWRTYDEAAIRALFAAAATYAYHPYAEAERGIDAIVASWVDEPDDAAAWETAYSPSMIAGRRAIATGQTRYREAGRVFSNLFELEFDADGRCSRFAEWYVEHPPAG